jgi:DNA repair exonuclease SbcCD nuclease subunit
MHRLKFVLMALLLACCGALAADAQVVIAQISDTHLRLKRAPEAAQNLRRVVEMVNQRHPDAVIVSGDIGENTQAWQEAKQILSGLTAPVYYVPGNHDDTANTVGRYRSVFGDNYYRFRVKDLTFFAIDSQLLGNFDVFESRTVLPLSAQGQAESAQMLDWFSNEIAAELRQEAATTPRGGAGSRPRLVFVVQHVPLSRAGSFPNDPKPYWTCQEPYLSRELALLHRLGVRHVFLGHWHRGMVYEADGITYHVAPATSWSPFGAPLGFALHKIDPDGFVNTEFVYLP